MTDTTGRDEELRASVIAIVAEEGMVRDRQISEEQTLDELGIASADFVMILMAIEEKFGAYVPVDANLTEAKTVGELLDVVCGHIAAHREREAS